MLRIQGIDIINILNMLVYSIDELKYIDINSIGSYGGIGSLNDILSNLLVEAYKRIEIKEREYKREERVSNKPSGRIDIYKSIVGGRYGKGEVYYRRSKFSEDIDIHRILKCVVLLLLSREDINEGLRKELEYIGSSLIGVKDIDVRDIDISVVDIERDDYRLLLGVMRMILGEYNMYNVGYELVYRLSDEERLKYIYEKFVREFYRREYKGKYEVTHKSYKTLDGKGKVITPDIVISDGDNYVVIDTKWYSRSNVSIDNTYQVNTYCDIIRERSDVKRIMGIILYHNKVGLVLQCNNFGYTMYKTDVRLYELSLRLNKDFEEIKRDLKLVLESGMGMLRLQGS